MGPVGSPQPQPCSWQLLALAQPPASCRLISRLHGSFGEHFFEAVDAFWGPSLALALAPALAQGRQTKALTRQDMGPRRSPPIDPLQAPTKKIQPASTAVLFTVFTAG